MSNIGVPDEVIETVLKQNDIIDIISKYVHLSKQGKNLKGLCPFHSEKTPSFTVSPDKQIFNCFGCGIGGNVIKFMMEIENYSFPEAVQQLAEDADIPFHWHGGHNENPEQQKEKSDLLKAHELSGTFFHYILKNTVHGKDAVQYLEKRGFSMKLINQFQIGYIPAMRNTLSDFLHKRDFSLPLMEEGGLLSKSDRQQYVDRFRDRIMFPITNARGNIIAFAGRILGDGQPKYLNSPETILFNKSKTLYNFYQAKKEIRKTGRIVLFEGYVDVIKAWDAGVLNGIATMGTAVTEEHATTLKRYADQIILCFDGDEAGQTAAIKNLSILEKMKFQVYVAMLPDLMDPDDYIMTHGSDRFKREVIENAVSATKYKILYLRKNFKLNDDNERLRYIRSALKIIAQLDSPTEREHYIKEMSSDFDYSFETLKQEMFEIKQELEKKLGKGDNNEKRWNNVMNGSGKEVAPSLLPAYHNAEKNLLAIMMYNRQITTYVEKEIGDQFNVEIHGAIAAYLYAFFAQHEKPDISKFLAMLRNDELENVASSISLIGDHHATNSKVIDDYIKQIKKFSQQHIIKQKRLERDQAERAGDYIRAAEIGKEIITLERNQK
ncbi:DNA primase [Chengkuizengella axinellae]|uniref:DNA primase n=1 Tax=Chengkuizengella axinellae TaxID=3064388 RepID=A0ABT9IUT5_9BACL|nr:DNA primase [Chengkuizengella sp. 2205SS18-9]MDP5273106.1 DNA primase [Chengkuizengella sp. 2205SS18-9]